MAMNLNNQVGSDTIQVPPVSMPLHYTRFSQQKENVVTSQENVFSGDRYATIMLNETEQQAKIRKHRVSNYPDYIREVEESEGFEVTIVPDIREIRDRCLQPVDPSKDFDKEEWVLCNRLAKLAVKAFNTYEKGKLMLDELVMATQEACNGIQYRLTFTATDKKSRKTEVYQARVYLPRNLVLGFRLKPKEGRKDWFWNCHSTELEEVLRKKLEREDGQKQGLRKRRATVVTSPFIIGGQEHPIAAAAAAAAAEEKEVNQVLEEKEVCNKKLEGEDVGDSQKRGLRKRRAPVWLGGYVTF